MNANVTMSAAQWHDLVLSAFSDLVFVIGLTPRGRQQLHALFPSPPADRRRMN